MLVNVNVSVDRPIVEVVRVGRPVGNLLPRNLTEGLGRIWIVGIGLVYVRIPHVVGRAADLSHFRLKALALLENRRLKGLPTLE